MKKDVLAKVKSGEVLIKTANGLKGHLLVMADGDRIFRVYNKDKKTFTDYDLCEDIAVQITDDYVVCVEQEGQNRISFGNTFRLEDDQYNNLLQQLILTLTSEGKAEDKIKLMNSLHTLISRYYPKS